MTKKHSLVALSKLDIAFLAPMAHVPNTLGFRLLAVLEHNRLAMPCTVLQDEKGCHYLSDVHCTRRSPSEFIGWTADRDAFTGK